MPDPDFKDIPDEMLENMAKGSARGVVMDVPFAGTGNPSAPSATPLSPTVLRSYGPAAEAAPQRGAAARMIIARAPSASAEPLVPPMAGLLRLL
jgi:hypothetical protein